MVMNGLNDWTGVVRAGVLPSIPPHTPCASPRPDRGAQGGPHPRPVPPLGSAVKPRKDMYGGMRGGAVRETQA